MIASEAAPEGEIDAGRCHAGEALAAEKVRIAGVLVLYKRTLHRSVTWQSLLPQVEAWSGAGLDFHLVICDNGPLQVPSRLPAWAEYYGAEENRGLAWAYDLGLRRARERGAEWLLTLDQDTCLPPDYLRRMAGLASRTSAANVAAIVPRLVGEAGGTHSPVRAHWLGEREIESGYSGVAAGVRAFNSAAMVRVAALQSIGGHDRRFWLNYLDHSVFHALQKAGHGVWVAGDLQIAHHLSLREGRAEMREEHFRDFSAAESAFHDLHGSRLENALFTARLLLRAINQQRRGDPAHFGRSTRRTMAQRLLLSRRERLRRWEAEVAAMSVEPPIAVHVSGSGPAADSGAPPCPGREAGSGAVEP